MLVSAQAPLDTLVVSHDNRRLVSARFLYGHVYIKAHGL